MEKIKHNKKLHNLYSSPNTMGVINLRRIMQEMRNAC